MLIYVAMPIGQAGADAGVSAFPGCGVAAVYGCLHLRGVDTSTGELTNRFLQLRPGITLDRLSLADMREVIESHGVRVCSVRWKPDDIASLPLPAILYIHPWRIDVRRDVGHVLLATSMDATGVELVDLTSRYGSVRLSFGEASQAWDGEAIVIEPAWPPSTFMGRLAAVAACVGGLLAASGIGWALTRKSSLARRAFRRVCSRALLAVMLSAIAGCSGNDQQVAPAFPLEFEEASYDFGTMTSDEGPLSHSVRFRVFSESAVRIVSAKATCSCVAVGERLLNQELAPLATHELEVTIDGSKRSGLMKEAIVLETEPSAARPMVLRFQVFVKSQPTAKEVVLRGAPDELLSGEIILSHVRTDEESQLEVDESRSGFGKFVVLEKRLSCEAQSGSPALATDILSLKVQARQPIAVLGKQESDIRIAWKTRDGRTRVPVVVWIEHPFRLRIDRLFLGEMKPDACAQLTVEAAAPAVREVSVREVRCPAKGWDAKWNKSDGSLSLNVRSPREAGRFEEEVVFLFERAIPEVHLPVSGIVRTAGGPMHTGGK